MSAASSSSSQQAAYGRRNIFYLRVSPYIVLPCILYVDPRHVLWLNTHPSTIPATLKILKGRILDKLANEAKVVKLKGSGGASDDDDEEESTGGNVQRGKRNKREKRIWGEISGKEVVDVARMADFNLAYFFRRQSDRHGVLIKEKEKVFPGQAAGSYGEAEWQRNARKRRRDTESEAIDDDEPYIKPDPEDEESAEMRVLGARTGNDAALYLEEQEELEDIKPKYKLKVRYRGFRIFPKSLILVLEPSPAARARSPELFTTQPSKERRQLSVTPAIGTNVASGTLYSSSTLRGGSTSRDRSDPRRVREDSTMSISSEVDSRRDARKGGAGGGTPLFRGSLTPSDGDGASSERGESIPWSPRPTPTPALAPPPTATSSSSRNLEEKSSQVDVQDHSQDPSESAFDLAERILTQSYVGGDGDGVGGADDLLQEGKGGGGNKDVRLEGRDLGPNGFGYGFDGMED